MRVDPWKIRIEFELDCFTYYGIDVIRKALITARNGVNDDKLTVQFKLLAPPKYQCEVVTHNRAEGEAKLNEAVKIMKKVMKDNDGKCKNITAPIIVKAGAEDDVNN